MSRNAVFHSVVLLLIILSAGYGEKLGVQGRVVDEQHNPIRNAIVNLVKFDSSVVTDSDGKFFIDMTSTRIIDSDPVSYIHSFRDGVLSFRIPDNQPSIHAEVFDTKGSRVNNIKHEVTGNGICKISMLPEKLPVAMYFIKLRVGRRTSVFNVLNLKNGTYSISGEKSYYEKTFSTRKTASSNHVDTIEISKEGYESIAKGISDYTANINEVTLKKIEDEGLPPVTGGKQARTTRYWDCCKPHCGWHSDMKMCDISGNEINDRNARSGCENGGTAFQCMDYAPIEVNSKVSYGWAAFNNQGTQCGECFQLDFHGTEKQMIVQVINIGDGGNDAFDLLIPGGGVGALNGCSRQWNNAPLGVQYGGFHASCGDNAGCIRNMCEAAFGDKEDLMRGCNWYLEWFNMMNNPGVNYMKVPCPQKIKDISHIGN